MSKTIDQKVVEMQFDNRQFEKNVSTTMSSVEKLKQSLNFKGAAKGLEDVGAATKKVDMNGLGSAVETVRAKFSALQVMGVTALANITNSAVNAGKRIVSALTIDPVKTGFQEYETQINAIQTILANTQSKGSTLEDVNRALDELNKYADMTIYNFTEMTRNIGTFTAAGVDLDKSVSSIKGIANLAAVSGSNAQQASTAMYQLSQALAAGKVQLMDWNSVVNAGMGGEVFQTALKRTAEHFGYNVDAMIKKYGSFRESLTEGGWLTAEVLTETLTQLSGAYTEADLIAQGYTKDQAKAIVELADTAVSAATDVKTFTQLWDTLKEAAQSGWTQSWEIIIGDFEEAKELLSTLYDFFSGIIQRVSDARNTLLEGAMTSNWERLTNQITEAGVSVDKFDEELAKTVKSHGMNVDELVKKYGSLGKAFQEGAISSDLIVETLKNMAGVSGEATKATEDMTGKLEYFQKVVHDVWMGDYKNGEERAKALTAAGYDYAQVQALVNKTVDGHKLTLEDLSDTQLKAVGYTQEEVTQLRELAEQAEKTGTPLNKLIEDISKPSGRELFWDSIMNILTSFQKVLGAVGDAWRDAFPPMTSEQLYNIIDAFHSFTEAMVPTEDTIEKLTRTLKGLFAILDIIVTITGGAFRIALRTVGSLLGMVDMNILDLTASIGDAIVGFRDFLFENNVVAKGIKSFATGLQSGIQLIKNWTNEFMELPVVQRTIANFNEAVGNIFSSFGDYFSEGGERLHEFIDRIKEMDTISLDGLKKIFKDFKDTVVNYFLNVGDLFDNIKLSVKNFRTSLEVNFSAAGKTLGNIISKIVEFAKTVKEKFTDVIGVGEILTIGVGVAIIYFAKKLGDLVGLLSSPLGAVADVLDNLGDVLHNYAFKLKAEAILKIAEAIAVLAASIAVLTLLDPAKMWSAVGAIVALSAALLALTTLMGKLNKVSGSIKGSTSLVALASSVLILVVALKKMEGLNGDTLARNIAILGVLAAGLATVSALLGKAAPQLSTGSIVMLSFAASLKILVSALDDLNDIDATNIESTIVLILGMIAGLSLIANSVKGIKMGSAATIIGIAVSLRILMGAFEKIAEYDTDKITNNIEAFVAIFGMFALLMASSHLAGQYAIKAGVSILAMSTALLLIIPAIKGLAEIEAVELDRALDAVSKLLLVFGVVTAMSKLAGPNAMKAGVMLLEMSGAIVVLTGAMMLLAKINENDLQRALSAIVTLELVFGALIAVTKLAGQANSSLIILTVAVGLLVASLGAISMIDSEKLTGATAALSVVILSFGTLVASTVLIKKASGTLLLLTGVVATLGGILYLLGSLPVGSTLEIAESLSLLMVSLSAVMLIASKAGTPSMNALVALGSMTLVVGAIAAIIGVLAYMDVGPTLEIAQSLSLLLTALSGACLILAAAGKVGAGAALQGALALDGVIVVVGGLMVGIGALATYFPAMEEFLDKGIGLLQAIGEGLGAFFGGIVGGIASGVTAGLPKIADNLSDFMEKLDPFLKGVSNINGDVLGSTKSLASMILTLTAADLLNGLASWLTGGSSLADFADDLVPFGEAMADFSDAVKGRIDAESVSAAANAGLTISQLASNLPKQGGILQSFLGTQDLDLFSSQLSSFGEAIADFSRTVKGKVDEESVTAAANAGMALAQLATNIPKANGVLQDFLGTQDLEVFGSQLAAFGKAIVGFSQTVKGKVDEAAVEAAASAGQALAELNRNIPKSNGVLQDFLGEQNLERFGEQLKAFGKAIAEFSITVRGKVTPEAVTAAVNAGTALSELNSKLPKQNGFMQNIFGEQDMEVFGEQLASFGAKFAEYSDHMKNVDPGVLSSTTDAAESIVKLANSLPDNKLFVNETTLNEFGAQLASFGNHFANYYASISGINTYTLSTVVDEVWRLLDLAKGMSGFDSKAMSSFGSNLKKLGNSGVDGFVESFTNATSRVQTAANGMITAFTDAINAKKRNLNTTFTSLVNEMVSTLEKKSNQFKMVGNSFATSLMSGLTEKQTTMTTGVTSMVSSMVTLIRNQYNSFKEAGKYVVSGFASGMNSNRSVATNAAKNLANSVLKSMKQTLQIHSPSRVVRDEVGKYIVEGLTEGLTSDMSAEEAASQKAQNITDAFQEEFEKLDVADQTDELERQLSDQNDDYTKRYESQLQRVELALAKYQNTLEVLGKEAIDTQKAYNEYLQEEVDLRDLEAEKTQAAYEASIQAIEERKSASTMSLVQELAAYKRLRSAYQAGSEQRIEIDQKILDLQEQLNDATEEYYNNLKSIQEDSENERLQIDQDYEDQRTQIKEDANQKRIELDEEYAEKEKQINEQLLSDIEAAEKEYEDAVESRRNTLYNSYGLFDSVEEKDPVDGSTLIKNLQDQLSAFADWTSNLNALSGRGLEEELIEELREMGPSSAAEIKALNEMTDEELNQYVELWKQKHELAKEQAVYELQGMREETDATIEQLKKDAETELEEYRQTWKDQLDQLNEETDDKLAELKRTWRRQIEDLDEQTNQKLEDLKSNWMETVLGLKEETENQFVIMTQDVVNILGASNNWSETGANMINGVLMGVINNTPKLVDGVEDAMRQALRAAERTLGINSPSKEFAKIGRYSDEGFAVGLKEYSNVVSETAGNVGNDALDSLRDSIARISDAINGKIDMQPTIRPVLDLSDIDAGASKLNALLNRNQALSINSGMKLKGQVEPADAEGAAKSSGAVYQFTQNNYSPKALSRVEIYRQSSNLFSAYARGKGGST